MHVGVRVYHHSLNYKVLPVQIEGVGVIDITRSMHSNEICCVPRKWCWQSANSDAGFGNLQALNSILVFQIRLLRKPEGFDLKVWLTTKSVAVRFHLQHTSGTIFKLEEWVCTLSQLSIFPSLRMSSPHISVREIVSEIPMLVLISSSQVLRKILPTF